MDEAYAALRDLEIDVHFVRVNASTGTVQAAYEQFGANAGKLNFNPTYDDTDDMDTRVQSNARAPFASESHDHSNHDSDDNC